MAVSIVNKVNFTYLSGSYGGPGASTYNITIPSTTAGNTLVAVVYGATEFSTPMSAKLGVQSFTAFANIAFAGPWVFVLTNINGVQTTITVTDPDADNGSALIEVYELTPCSLDTHTANTKTLAANTSSASIQANVSITGTRADDIYFFFGFFIGMPNAACNCTNNNSVTALTPVSVSGPFSFNEGFDNPSTRFTPPSPGIYETVTAEASAYATGQGAITVQPTFTLTNPLISCGSPNSCTAQGDMVWVTFAFGNTGTNPNARVDQQVRESWVVDNGLNARVDQLIREAWVTICEAPPVPSNFNYVKSFPLTNGELYTVALDAAGTLWSELVGSLPIHQMTPISTSILPNSSCQSTTEDDVEYLCFGNWLNGVDVPRQYNPQPASPPSGQTWTLDRISQVGPGASPTFQVTNASGAGQATITSWAGVGGIVTFQAVNSFTAGEVVTLSAFTISTFFNGRSFAVLGTGLSGSQFEVAFSGYSGGSDSGIATPQFGYGIVSITQSPAGQFNGQIALWSAGPGLTDAGTTITFYYASKNSPENTALINAINSGFPVYVYIVNAPFGNGTQLVTGHGIGAPPGESPPVPFFTISTTISQYQKVGGPSTTGNTGTFQVTIATLYTALPIPGLSAGDQITITGESPSGWNSTWTIINALLSGTYTITQTQMTSGTATYTWQWSGSGPAIAPTAGQLITVLGTLNGNGIFNVTDASIATVTGGPNSGTLTVTGFTVSNIPSAAEDGQAQTAGTQFQFDPGQQTLGTLTPSPIFGNGGTGGVVSVTGSNTSIGAGTRQGVCFFETRNGYKTACSAPVTFTTDISSNYIIASNIPIGPPNVIRRWISFTVAGQNGVPGPNFYTIDTPVSYQLNGQTYQYSATYIDDNVTTTAKFTFTDAILQAGDEIDVQGNDLFNEIEMGSVAWCVAYAQRMFFGLEQNKVLNFNNLTFDGGYLPNSAGVLTPLGWGVDPGSNGGSGLPSTITAFQIGYRPVVSGIFEFVFFTATNSFITGEQVTISGLSVGTELNGQTYTIYFANSTEFWVIVEGLPVTPLTSDSGIATPLVFGATLVPSPIFGDAFFISNNTGSTQSTLGMILQGAYQDAYNVPIILPNTLYSVRVTASIPSGNTSGSLVVDLTEFDQGLISGSQTVNAYGTTYGSFTIPFSSMTTSQAIYTGTLLTSAFITGVPKGLVLRVWAQNIVAGANVMVDRIEIFPTAEPLLATNIRVSYVDNFEAFDGVTGNLGLASHNTQPCYGAAEMHDQLYFLQSSSMQSTQDVPGVEPSAPGGGWPVHEVSNRVGACGIHAYDYGEEWILTACRNGVFGFNGGQPIRIDFQQKELWELINWQYGNKIVLRNDLVNRRILCAVPLKTPNRWLPLAPMNTNPTSPNVVFMWNYQGLGDFQELVSGHAVHTTMFGTLAAVDMKIKFNIWNIVTPYIGLITDFDGSTQNVTICNGVGNEKIYTMSSEQLSDDGVAINSTYVTWGFVNSAKASQFPLLGFSRKTYSMIQQLIYGSGNAAIKVYPNWILDPNTLAFNPFAYTVPGGVTMKSVGGESIRPLNVSGQRAFVSYSTNAVGAAFTLSKMILYGVIAPFNTVNPNSN